MGVAWEGALEELECRECSGFNLVRKRLVKINFLVEQGENAINPEGTNSGNDVYSEEARKLSWMRETRIRILMQT